MATITKQQSTKIEAAMQSVEDELAKRTKEMEREAEAVDLILRKACLEGVERLDPAHVALCQRNGYPDADNSYGLRSMMSRVSRVIALMAQAGSSADLEAAQAKLADAEQAVSKQSPELERIISEATAKLNELTGATATAQDEVTRRVTARTDLRDVAILPPFIRERHKAVFSNACTNLLNSRRIDLEDELLEMQNVADADLDSEEGREWAFSYARSHSSDDFGLVQEPFTGRVTETSTAWQEHVDSLSGRRAEVESELEAVEGKLAKISADAEAVRDFYLSQLV